VIVATMEALLIEGLEPPQNRRRGDDFRAIEYIQREDPELERRRLSEPFGRDPIQAQSALKRGSSRKQNIGFDRLNRSL
jgi:hypothetical protein